MANLTVAQMRQRFHFAYVQDDFKVNRKLTLKSGITLRMKNLVILPDFNQARPFTTAEVTLIPAQRPSLQARRPIASFGTISMVLRQGFSNYNALQVKLEHRFANGLYFLNSFTYSKAMDNASQVLEEPNGNTGTPQNVYDIQNDRGIGAYEQPFNNTTSFVFEVPFGRGRAFGSGLNSALDAVSAAGF